MSNLHPTPSPTTSKARRLADTRATPAKPTKPSPDFPLFAHAIGRWAKKIRGSLVYFGPWSDPAGALRKYLEQKDALHGGRTPRPEATAVTVKDVANAFLNHRQKQVETGELAARTWKEYKATADAAVRAFGKSRLAADLGPEDFAALRDALAKSCGPVRLGNEIQRVRCLFKHAHEAGLLDRPVRFGPGAREAQQEGAAAAPREARPETVHGGRGPQARRRRRAGAQGDDLARRQRRLRQLGVG